MVGKVGVGQPEPVVKPTAVGIPECAVDATVASADEQIDVVPESREARYRGSGRNRETIAEILVDEPEPAIEPAAVGIPERAVDGSIETRDEQIDVILKTRKAGHERVNGNFKAIGEVGVAEPEPVIEPAAVGIPERRVDSRIAAHNKQIEMVSETAQRADLGLRRHGKLIAEIVIDEPEPAVEPAPVRIPEGAVDSAFQAGSEQI